MKWYIIHAYSGFERKVKESLESRVQAFGLQDKIGKVLIPTESVTEVRGGKKYTSERMFYPGYVLVEWTWTITSGMWSRRHRVLLDCRDWATADAVVRMRKSGTSFTSCRQPRKAEAQGQFEKNETVRISEGPFATFTGVVDEVNEDRETVKVMVTIFGRSTPVELEFGQVEKVA